MGLKTFNFSDIAGRILRRKHSWCRPRMFDATGGQATECSTCLVVLLLSCSAVRDDLHNTYHARWIGWRGPSLLTLGSSGFLPGGGGETPKHPCVCSSWWQWRGTVDACQTIRNYSAIFTWWDVSRCALNLMADILSTHFSYNSEIICFADTCWYGQTFFGVWNSWLKFVQIFQPRSVHICITTSALLISSSRYSLSLLNS
jgi:hypothetical protein